MLFNNLIVFSEGLLYLDLCSVSQISNILSDWFVAFSSKNKVMQIE